MDTAFTFIIAFAIAMLSGMGLGGGGLFAVYLAVFTDVPQLAVQGFNLIFFLFAAGASVAVRLFGGRVDITSVGVMTATGLAGSLVGVAISGMLSDLWLRRAFGFMLITAGIMAYRAAAQKYSKKISTEGVGFSENATESSEKKSEK